jgi:outer membrane protein TolC
VELLRDTVFEEQVGNALRAAEADESVAREHLDEVLGLYGTNTTWTIADDALAPVPDAAPSVDDLEEKTIEASLDLDAARWRLEADGQRIALARLDSFLPSFGVGVSAKRETGSWGVGPAIGISLPLFDWGTSERTTAWARLRRNQSDYAAIAIDARARARAVASRVTSAYARAKDMREHELPDREKLLDASLRQVNAMNMSPFELLVIRREGLEAEERYVAALRDYWVASAEADSLRAGALPDRSMPEDTP